MLKTLPDNSVDCVITSPPYWQLRDYHVEGQLGIKPDFQQYLSRLCDIFEEVKRALKPAGTCWVNISDTYASQGARNAGFNQRWHGKLFRSYKQAATDTERPQSRETGLPKKSLVLIPFRFAVETLNRGWLLRNTIIWHKPNCLPASVRGRFTVDFEYLFFFLQRVPGAPVVVGGRLAGRPTQDTNWPAGGWIPGGGAGHA